MDTLDRSHANDFATEGSEQQQWYRRWGHRPLAFALLRPVPRMLFILLLWMFIRGGQGFPKLFEDPAAFLKARAAVLLLVYVLIVLIARYRWRQQAFEYAMAALLDQGLEQPAPGGPVQKAAQRAAARIPRLYARWAGARKWLMILIAFLVTLAGLLPLFLSNAVEHGDWGWQGFVTLFEGGYLLLAGVAGIYLFFGAWLGHLLWKQIVENYTLLQANTSARD
jgi:hypothetical protein